MQEENVPPQTNNTNPTQTPPPITTEKSKKGLIIFLSLLSLVSLSLAGFFGYKYWTLSQEPTEQADQAQPTPTPSTDPAANWRTYKNTEYNYTIKYPPTFITQVLSAGAGTKEAPSNAGNLYIYNPTDEETYINRYINLEVLSVEPTFTSDWTRTQITLDGKKATKLVNTNQESLFDIYLIPLDSNQGVLMIYVSNTTDKKSLANQMLSTFKFTNNSSQCYNQTLNAGFTLPSENWTCESEELGNNEGTLNIKSPLFTITVSNLGRGPYCGYTLPDSNDEEACEITSFYSNENLELTMYKVYGENKEIFGSPTKINQSLTNDLLWISIKYQNMGQRELTENEKSELYSFLNSIYTK